MDWIAGVTSCPVLKGVDPESLREHLKEVKYSIKRFEKDAIIASQGDEVNRLMILLHGSVRGEMTDPEGRVIKIEDIAAPKPLAAAFMFGKENRFPVDVVANGEVRVLVIYREDFLKLLRMNETIQMNYLSIISSKAQFLSKKLKFLSFKTVRGKFAHYITGLSPGKDGTIQLPATQQEMADLFGVARPSVARGIAELEREGVLLVRNRMVQIIDQQKLNSYLNE